MVKNQKDFYSGLLFAAFAIAFFYFGRDYSMGAASKMGPGYFPKAIAGLMLAIGLYLSVEALFVPGEPVGVIAFKALGLVTLSVILFGFLLPRAGLIVALATLVAIASSASAHFKADWQFFAALAALIVFCWAIFVRGLGIPMPIVGSWFGA